MEQVQLQLKIAFIRLNFDHSTTCWTGGISTEPRVDTFHVEIVFTGESADNVGHDVILHTDGALIILLRPLMPPQLFHLIF